REAALDTTVAFHIAVQRFPWVRSTISLLEGSHPRLAAEILVAHADPIYYLKAIRFDDELLERGVTMADRSGDAKVEAATRIVLCSVAHRGASGQSRRALLPGSAAPARGHA